MPPLMWPQCDAMGGAIVHWIEAGGIVIVLVLMAAESAGIPFPSEVIMPVAGFLSVQGHLSLWGAIVAGTAGNVIGSLIAYALAARWGRPLLLGPGRRVGLRASHLALADGWFERYGLAAVLVGRLLPVIRTYISFPAGLARVELLRFTVLTGVGAFPWCVALAAAGRALGANWDRVARPIETAALGVAIAVVLVLAAWLVRGRRQSAG